MRALKKNLLIAAVLFIAISATAAVLKKEIPPYNDCSPNATFWGNRCCPYLVVLNTIPGPVTVEFEKCCDYRFFISIGCETHGGTIYN